MDPRTFTVKPCPASYAAKSSADIGNASSLRRDFFNSVGKLGDLQVLNSIGAGSIGTGLRTLGSSLFNRSCQGNAFMLTPSSSTL